MRTECQDFILFWIHFVPKNGIGMLVVGSSSYSVWHHLIPAAKRNGPIGAKFKGSADSYWEHYKMQHLQGSKFGREFQSEERRSTTQANKIIVKDLFSQALICHLFTFFLDSAFRKDHISSIGNLALSLLPSLSCEDASEVFFPRRSDSKIFVGTARTKFFVFEIIAVAA